MECCFRESEGVFIVDGILIRWMLDLNSIIDFYVLKRERMFSLFILILYTCTGCVREEVLDDIESKYFKEQLVIQSIISPGDSVFVYVGKTIPLGDSIEEAKVFDASITLSDGEEHSVSLPLLNSNTPVYGISQKNFPIEAGKTYILAVKHADLPAISASCTVPSVATSIDTLEYLGTTTTEENDVPYLVRAKWKNTDQPYLERIYALDHYQKYLSEDNSFLEEGTYYTNPDAFHGIQSVDSYYIYNEQFSKSTFYIDTFIEGGIVKYAGPSMEAYMVHEVEYYLITPDENLAQYQSSFDFFRQNRSALEDDSFIDLYRGVIPEYSNVKNGLGVFGAYLRSEPVHIYLQ